MKDFTVELVPIIEINHADEAENITDVSLLHVKWVSHHRQLLTTREWQRHSSRQTGFMAQSLTFRAFQAMWLGEF